MGDVIKVFTGSGSIDFDDRGDLDLTKQIEVLKARIADLESIEETHRKLNQELRKEIWQYKEKAGQVEALESRVRVDVEPSKLVPNLAIEPVDAP